MNTYIFHFSGLVKVNAENEDDAQSMVTNDMIAENMEIREIETLPLEDDEEDDKDRSQV